MASKVYTTKRLSELPINSDIVWNWISSIFCIKICFSSSFCSAYFFSLGCFSAQYLVSKAKTLCKLVCSVLLRIADKSRLANSF